MLFVIRPWCISSFMVTQLIVCFCWFHLRVCFLCACVLAALLDFPGLLINRLSFPCADALLMLSCQWREPGGSSLRERPWWIGVYLLLFWSRKLVRWSLSGPCQRVADVAGSVSAIVHFTTTVPHPGVKSQLKRKEREREREKGKRRFCDQCCIVDVKEKSTEQY